MLKKIKKYGFTKTAAKPRGKANVMQCLKHSF